MSALPSTWTSKTWKVIEVKDSTCAIAKEDRLKFEGTALKKLDWGSGCDHDTRDDSVAVTHGSKNYTITRYPKDPSDPDAKDILACSPAGEPGGATWTAEEGG
ncbi:MAG TPA: hypothetical protein VGX68_04800 [Thermoanaerobaculia bacterium]|jgi:hypothetical protein|nr:hypothetical protein [Thermoanaerobaculia bacterium]